MDDDEDEREFSRSIVYGFFDQAEVTFKKMDDALLASPKLLSTAPLTCLLPTREHKDLPTLSSLGHFLKGSSATLGLTKVKDSCEKIQHYGGRKAADGNPVPWDDDKLIRLIKETLGVVKSDYTEAERILKKYYHDSSHS